MVLAAPPTAVHARTLHHQRVVGMQPISREGGRVPPAVAAHSGTAVGHACATSADTLSPAVRGADEAVATLPFAACHCLSPPFIVVLLSGRRRLGCEQGTGTGTGRGRDGDGTGGKERVWGGGGVGKEWNMYPESAARENR